MRSSKTNGDQVNILSDFKADFPNLTYAKVYGWSRWIKANKTRPTPLHEAIIKRFVFDDPKEDDYEVE
jgi:hypothetical protein